MLGAAELERLRSGAVLVNVSRGKVIDAAALSGAACAGDVVACLDVFDPEPVPLDSPLLDLRTSSLSPHLAGVTEESRRRFFSLMVDECLRHFQGLEPWRELTAQVVELRGWPLRTPLAQFGAWPVARMPSIVSPSMSRSSAGLKNGHWLCEDACFSLLGTPGAVPIQLRSRGRRLPRDQLGLEADVPVAMEGVNRLRDQELGGRTAQLVLRLADGGERRREHLGEIDVVVSDHADVAGNADAPLGERSKDSERDLVVDAHDGGRPIRKIEELGRLPLRPARTP